MKKILILYLTICMFIFVACNKEEKTTTTGTDIQWEFKETDNPDAALWENHCNSIIEIVSSLPEIKAVAIYPTDYESYVDKGKVVITCHLEADVEVEDIESGIKGFIDSANVFEEYELVFE